MFSANQNTLGKQYFSTNPLMILCQKFIDAIRTKFHRGSLAVNPLVFSTDLIIRVPLKNNTGTYAGITLNERAGVMPGECKLKDGEHFMPTGACVYLRKVPKDGAETTLDIGNCLPSSFPDPNVFNDGAAGPVPAYKSLNTIYNLGANIVFKSEGVDFIEKVSGINFLHAPDRSYTPAAASGAPQDIPQQHSRSLPAHPINPTCCVIEGGKANEFTYTLAPGDWSNLEGGKDDPNFCYEMVVVISGKRYAGQTKASCNIL